MALQVATAATSVTGTVATPAYSGTFIPELWASKLLEKFYAGTVIGAIFNTDYEGLIRNVGDRVKIRTIPKVNIRPYVVGQALVNDRPSSPTLELTIDKGNYWSVELDDIFEVQSDINLMNMWGTDASQQMKIAIDTTELAGLLHAADPANRGPAAGKISQNVNLGVTGTPVSVTDNVKDNTPVGIVGITKMFVRLGQVLDEQNIPQDGRWVIVSPGLSSLLKTSELANAMYSGDTESLLRNGRVGMINKFTIYESNLLPQGAGANANPGLAQGESVMLAGHRHAATFASQLSKVETLQVESTFAKIMRGLQIWGSAVLDPTALAEAIVTY